MDTSPITAPVWQTCATKVTRLQVPVCIQPLLQNRVFSALGGFCPCSVVKSLHPGKFYGYSNSDEKNVFQLPRGAYFPARGHLLVETAMDGSVYSQFSSAG